MHLRNTGLIALAVLEVLIGVLIVHWLLQDFLLLSLIGPCLTAIGLHALGQAQHESFHRLLFPGKAINDAVGKILCSWVLASAFAGLRELHFRHHGKFASDEDPDSWHWAGVKDGRSATCLALKVLCFHRIWSSMRLIRSTSRMPARDGERIQVACLQNPRKTITGGTWSLLSLVLFQVLDRVLLVITRRGGQMRVVLKKSSGN